MPDTKSDVADAVKALAQADKGRTIAQALDAVHQGRRDPLRFVQQVK